MILIRGVLIKDITLRVIIGQRFVDMWEKYQKYLNYPKKGIIGKPWINFWENSIWNENNQQLTTCELLSKKLGVNIWTWPKGSKFYCRKFILSNSVNSIHELYDSVITLTPEMVLGENEIDKQLLFHLSKYGIYDDVKTFVLPLSML